MKDINAYDEINLKELISYLRKTKVFTMVTTSFFCIGAIVFSISLPNIYTSNALLAPTQQKSDMGNFMGSYSGLANIAGISLPSSSSSIESIALETLDSFKFYEENILPEIFLPDLMAYKSWDQKLDRPYYDNSLYDSQNNKWVRNVNFPKNIIPSAQESYTLFHDKHFSFSKNKDNGFLLVTVKHKSPFIAKKWTEIIINSINSSLREEQKARSRKSIDYLNSEISKTNYPEIKEAISNILQSEIEKLMLIEANSDFVFRIIDPPIASEVKSEPQRGLIILISTLLGALISLLCILVAYFFKDK